MADTPVHLATATSTTPLPVFDFPGAVQAYVRSLCKGRQTIDLEVTITEAGQDKTAAQVRGFHAMIAPWARQRGESLDVVKQLCLREAFGTIEVVHPGTGLVFDVLAEPHTSKLSRAKYAHLIETAIQLAAEDVPSCILQPPDAYRQERARLAQAAERGVRS